ncbi:ATP-binding protein [Pontibacter sp. SGAir0037]|uniref:ATP-binding protein n=1 Tax=Pontibacter sp. SGAir0037 TaxID=2571030 RepID=UPI0010CD5AD7|nr:ATP-binding protein [Pontibacter sp. SGAir0037]QCR22509.1 hypothetical protein C1N53_09285 [Pontibacter sp. SGAir0037]
MKTSTSTISLQELSPDLVNKVELTQRNVPTRKPVLRFLSALSFFAKKHLYKPLLNKEAFISIIDRSLEQVRKIPVFYTSKELMPLYFKGLGKVSATPVTDTWGLPASSQFPVNEGLPSLWSEAEILFNIGCWELEIVSGRFKCSPAVYHQLGLTAATELKGITALFSLFKTEDTILIQNRWEKILTYDADEIDQVVELGSIGLNKWFRFRAKPVFEEFKLVKIVGTLQNVTELKEAELTAKAEMVKAVEAVRQKSESLSVISHDMRTPLNSIIGQCFLMMQEETLPQEHKESLNTIHFSSQNLLNLINNILDISKIEAAKVEVESINFQLRSLLKKIHQSLSIQANEKHLNFDLCIDDKVPALLEGDPAKLTQVLNNLLSNAIKFTARGCVRLKVDIIYQSDQGYVLEFVVSDTGIGIPEHLQQHIFESYTQANASISRQYGGTGLGLAITHKLIKLQKGTIKLKSSPGFGSIFTVRLKFNRPKLSIASTEEQSQREDQHSDLFGSKILVIDDNAFNRVITCKLLSTWNAAVEAADNGYVALEMLKTESYDLILLDLQMPVMDGFQALKEMQKLKIKTPIIALTGNANSKEKNYCLMNGCSDYLTKPYIPQELYTRIRQTIKRIN